MKHANAANYVVVLGHYLAPMFILCFMLLVSRVAAQPQPQPPMPYPSLPFPPPSPSVPVNLNPLVAMLIMLVFSAFFLVIFFSIYVVHITSSTSEPVLHVGMDPVLKGLDAEVIMEFPTLVYSDVKEHKIGKGALECAVCLCEFEDYETLRLIPKCDHVFHPECIDEWLSGHVTCPVCRANLAPRSGDSVEDRTDGSGPEENPHVEIDIDEPTPQRPPYRLGRSHSTGHSLARPRDDTERFTLRLPEDVRKQIMERPMTPYFPSEGSSRRGGRSGDGRFLRRLDRLDRPTKSERWVFSKMPSFLTRVSSMVPPKSPKLVERQ